MYVVQPSLSQKCVEFAWLWDVQISKDARWRESADVRDAVAEPGMGKLVHDNIDLDMVSTLCRSVICSGAHQGAVSH